jgi:hypothetical protein
VWLPLLLMFVLCACLTGQVSWAESQQQKIELQSEGKPVPPDNGNRVSDFLPHSVANEFLPACSVTPEMLPPAGCDTCLSITLHGPPDRYYPG